MVFDFSKPMTTYELIAITLASLALFIPAVKWLIKEIFYPLKLSFIPQDNSMILLFNESGPYVSVGFSLHCQNKSILLKNIRLLIKRKSDNAQLSLIWSRLHHPTSQLMPDGNSIFLKEVARPLQLHANTLHLFSMDFFNTSVETNNKLLKIQNEKMCNFNDINIDEVAYDDAIEMFKNQQKYQYYYEFMLEEMFWKSCGYEFNIVATYDNNKKYIESFKFNIAEEEYEGFKKNIEITLLCRLNAKYKKQNIWNTCGATFTKV